MAAKEWVKGWVKGCTAAQTGNVGRLMGRQAAHAILSATGCRMGPLQIAGGPLASPPPVRIHGSSGKCLLRGFFPAFCRLPLTPSRHAGI